jgi:hypothetical protein
MYRLRVFALAGLGLLGVTFGSAQAGWHCRPTCAPVVACAPTPIVTPAPVNCVPAPCPVVTYYPTYYRTHYYGYRHYGWRHCR